MGHSITDFHSLVRLACLFHCLSFLLHYSHLSFLIISKLLWGHINDTTMMHLQYIYSLIKSTYHSEMLSVQKYLTTFTEYKIIDLF